MGKVQKNRIFRRILSAAVVLCLIFGLFSFHAAAVSEESKARALDKIAQLTALLDKTYFTTTQKTCGNSSCSKCLNGNVCSSQWFVDMFGYTVDGTQFARQYYPDGSLHTSLGYSCYGFASFAFWYIFAENTSSSMEKNIVCTVSKSSLSSALFNYKTLSKYALPGDIIRIKNQSQSDSAGGGHSVIFISCDKSGVWVLDCNYGERNIVQKHYIRYSDTYYGYAFSTCPISITHAKNYETVKGGVFYVGARALAVKTDGCEALFSYSGFGTGASYELCVRSDGFSHDYKPVNALAQSVILPKGSYTAYINVYFDGEKTDMTDKCDFSVDFDGFSAKTEGASVSLESEESGVLEIYACAIGEGEPYAVIDGFENKASVILPKGSYTAYLICEDKSFALTVLSQGAKCSAHKAANGYICNNSEHRTYCSLCGEVLSAKAHEFGKETVITAPTEGIGGISEKTCSVCNKTVRFNTDAIGYRLGAYRVVNTGGMNIRENAGTQYTSLGVLAESKVFIADEISGEWAKVYIGGAVGYIFLGGGYTEYVDCIHKFDITTVVASTCSKSGYDDKVCLLCGASESVSLELAAHSTGDWEFDELSHWKTCSLCGQFTDEGLHDGETCAVCGYEKPKPEPYKVGNYKVLCSKLNVRSGAGTNFSSLGTLSANDVVEVTDILNDWGKVAFLGKDGYIFLGEGYTERIGCAHLFDAGTVLRDAEIGISGEVEYVCAICGEKKTEVIPALEMKAGDCDRNGTVNSADAVSLLYAVLFPQDFELIGNFDLDGNGKVDEDDVIFLLMCVYFPDEFTLESAPRP